MVGRQILGCVVTDEEADEFRSKLPEGVTTTDAIRWFIWQIATEQMHIEVSEW